MFSALQLTFHMGLECYILLGSCLLFATFFGQCPLRKYLHDESSHRYSYLQTGLIGSNDWQQRVLIFWSAVIYLDWVVVVVVVDPWHHIMPGPRAAVCVRTWCMLTAGTIFTPSGRIVPRLPRPGEGGTPKLQPVLITPA